MTSTGVKTILYPVRDLAKTQELFTRLLGVAPTSENPYYVGYEIDGQQIGLVPGGHDSQQMTGTTAFLHVDDIDAAMRAVLDAGGATQQEAKDVGGGRLVGAVTDAEANVIGFIQDA